MSAANHKNVKHQPSKFIIGTALISNLKVYAEKERHFLIHNEGESPQKATWLCQTDLFNTGAWTSCFDFLGRVDSRHRGYQLDVDGTWERQKQLYQNFTVEMKIPKKSKAKRHRKKISKGNRSKDATFIDLA
jgi:hypothetical protein